MSATWDSQAEKTTPIAADEVLIIDTEDSRIQKRALLSNLVGVWSRNSSSGFTFPTTLTDKVGIGTITPSVALDVVGTINASVKYQQGGSTILVGDATDHNLFVGLNTGSSTVTSQGNTAIGDDALKVLVGGGSNTAIGADALAANIDGDENTAVGDEALLVNTADGNEAFGYHSLHSNTTGTGNSALGHSSLMSNTTGTHNVGVGDSSLESNILGRRNTVIGANSGLDIISATLTGENTLLGYNTGRGITTGVQNTVIGANVSGLSSTLSNNIILADGAGVVRLQFDSSGDATIDGAFEIGGDLTIKGTTTSIITEKLDVADNHIYMNSEYETAVAQTVGLVVNYLPTSTIVSIVSGVWTAGVASTSNPTVTTIGSSVLSAGDLIQIRGTTNAENNGIFEVLSETGNVLTIRGVGVTATVEDFTDNQFVSNSASSAVITKITVSVIRSGTDGVWESAAGSTTGFSFDNIVGLTATQTLENKSIDWTNNTMSFTSAEIAAACSDETGSNSLVFSTAPTIIIPTFTGTVTGPSGSWISVGMKLGSGDEYFIDTVSVLNTTTLGSTVVSSSLTSLGTLSSLTITGDLTVDTNTLFVDSTNNQVGIGTLSPIATLHVETNTVSSTIIPSGDADDFIIENVGNTGYTVAPTVTISDPDDTVTGTATAVMGTGVESLALVSGGTGYSDTETVTITGVTSGASNATATITAVSGIITSIDSIDTVGTGYTVSESVTITGQTSGATDASVTATISQFVASITIVLAGQGYVSAPTVTIAAPTSGTTATATSSLSNTVLSAITVTEAGIGYTSTPTVTIGTAPTKVTATATAVISGGKVVSVTIDTGGVGYNVPPPVVTFSGGDGTGVGVDMTTVSGSAVTSITVTQGGSGLTIVSDTDQVGVIAFEHAGQATRHGRILFDHSDNSMTFSSSTTSGLRIDSDGHVAVTQNAVDLDEVFAIESADDDTASRMLVRGATNKLLVGYDGSETLKTTDVSAQVIVPTGTDDLILAGGALSTSNIRFYTSSGSIISEKMRIDSSGNVGIGLTDPDTSLHIGNNVGNFQIGGKNDTVDNRLIIDNSGNITHTFGLNDGSTTGNHGRFRILNNVNNVLEVNNDSAGYLVRNNTGKWAALTGGASAGAWKFWTGGTSTNQTYDDLSAAFAMIIDDSQNVGIGLESSVSAKLHVLETTEQLRLGYDASNYTSFTVDFTGFGLLIANYDSKSFGISEDTLPTGSLFNSDGTTMIILGNVNKTIYQYSLSTAEDISTASYDSVSFSISTESSAPIDFKWNSDGTKIYILDLTGTVFQYSLSTAYTISTMSYDSVSFSVTSQDTAPEGIAFNLDGSKMFIAGNTNDTIYQYDLSTNFVVSSAVYNSISFGISEDSAVSGISFNSDGTRMLVLGFTNKNVFQYTLTTGYDLSTASYDSISFNVGSQDSAPANIGFNSDGSKMYMVGDTNDTIYQYSSNTGDLIISPVGGNVKFLSTHADTLSISTITTTGTNAGTSSTFVGSQDPDGNVIAAGGDIYIRDNGALSRPFFNKEATTGTDWEGISLIPSQVHQLFSTAEYEDLGTASVITTSAVRSLNFKASVVSSTRHTVSDQDSELQFIDQTEGNQMIYTGTSTFITAAAGGDITSRNAALIAAVSGTQLFDYVGEGKLAGVDIIEIVQSSNLAQWNLGTIGRVSTGIAGPIVRFKDTNIITTQDSLTLDTCVIIEVTSCLFDDTAEVGSGGPLFSIKNTGYKEGRAVFLVNGGRLYSGESLVRIDAGVPENYRVEVIDSLFIINSGGSIFDISGSTGTFTAVADASISATTITGVTDSSGVASFTHAGTTPPLGSLVVISGFTTNTDYNTTGIVTASTSTTFEVDYVSFGTSETGSYLVNQVTITSTAHGLTLNTGVTLDTDLSTDYDGGFLIYSILTNSFNNPGTFTSSLTGTWSTEGLDQSDPRVRAFNNPGTSDSKTIAEGVTNSNSTATTITDGTYAAISVATHTVINNELLKLIDATAAIWEYQGNETFNGKLTGNLSGIKTGSTGSYRIAMSTNGVVPTFATANYIPMEVKTTTIGTPLEFSVVLDKGDTIQIMMAGDGTSDNITVTDLKEGIQ